MQEVVDEEDRRHRVCLSPDEDEEEVGHRA